MTNQPMSAPGAPGTGGAYAQAMETTGASRILHVSGQIPVTIDGTVPEGFEAQCRQVWANITAQLTHADMSLGDVVKVTTYLSDRVYRDDNSRIRREVLGDLQPALTVIIAGIYDPAWLLEIEVVAAR